MLVFYENTRVLLIIMPDRRHDPSVRRAEQIIDKFSLCRYQREFGTIMKPASARVIGAQRESSRQIEVQPALKAVIPALRPWVAVQDGFWSSNDRGGSVPYKRALLLRNIGLESRFRSAAAMISDGWSAATLAHQHAVVEACGGAMAAGKRS